MYRLITFGQSRFPRILSPQKSSRASLPLSHLRVEGGALLVPRRVAAVPVERTRCWRRRRLWAAASLVTVPGSWSSPRWRHIWRLHSSTKPMKSCNKLEEQYILITKFYVLDIRTLFSPIPWSLEPKRLVHTALFARLEDVHHLHWAHLSNLYLFMVCQLEVDWGSLSRLRFKYQPAWKGKLLVWSRSVRAVYIVQPLENSGHLRPGFEG